MRHEGPYHDDLDKRSLAIHLGVPHNGPDGRVRHVVHPTAAVRSRWRLDELKNEHRILHGGTNDPHQP